MKKQIALTFDDGPNTTVTPLVLDILKQYGIAATFFLVGDNINEQSALSARRAVEQGCMLENHSATHSDMSKMSREEFADELNRTDKMIEAICGRTPKFFRPPYIAVSSEMYEYTDKTFICGLGADDWDDAVSVSQRTDRILEQLSDGVIILLHDSKDNYKTVEALKRIIPEALSRGYEFLTVEGLFAAKNITPQKGVLYSNVLM